MAEFNGNIAVRPLGSTVSRAEAAAIDAGLRAHMIRIYNYMVLGLAITGIAALAIYMLSVTDDAAAAAKVARSGAEIPARLASNMYLTPIGYAVFVSPLKWPVILAPLALVFGLSFGIDRLRPAVAQFLFWVYAALLGVSLGSIFMIYTHTSVVRVFLITAASFGALSLWGYTTQRDLTGLGSFLVMGLFGIIIAGLVNIFLASSALQWVISVAGVLVFSGLTAWDTQRLKGEYIYGAMDGDIAERTAIMGALSLYLDFVNLFTMLLQLFGEREE
ncbi:MAG TPA: Bax inhibitor-1/YccA family protein [Xanthobacteraceae bacterium]|nr:Bax inhibitor-1/YccA family protein [Xanthobacteraceae bacterium]